MKYRKFGRTNILMPVFTCGGMRFQHSWEHLRIGEIPDDNQANLEATVIKAYNCGINHFETARGYGTSEIQLGQALKHLPREDILVQTKIAPTGDIEEFKSNLENSFLNLQIDYADFIALHGINDIESYENALKCLAVLEEWRNDGRIRFIGFSTHASTDLIIKTIKTDRFDYVNMHYYFIFQDNFEALRAAEKADLGILIISPNDKGGKLYDPPVKLKGLTAPLTPMQFNDLFCLADPAVKTLTIGASKPEDFDEHLAVLDSIDESGGVSDNTYLSIADKLYAELERVLGCNWINCCCMRLPDYKETPEQINIPVILRLYNLAKGLNMTEYRKMRYNLLGNGGTWFPGNNAEKAGEHRNEIIELCRKNNFPDPDRIPDILIESHEMFSEKNDK
jgi:predicted aldo/keto reductase-like oxidoreductase